MKTVISTPTLRAPSALTPRATPSATWSSPPARFRGPRHRRYPRGHRRTGGAELQERGRHSGGRRRHSRERGEDHLFPGGHGRLRRLQRGVRQVFHLKPARRLRGRARRPRACSARSRPSPSSKSDFQQRGRSPEGPALLFDARAREAGRRACRPQARTVSRLPQEDHARVPGPQ